MDLRNWETFVVTGAPVQGAAVEVYEATLEHPNPGAILDTTVTDNNGMWEFIALSNTPKDVKITYLGITKWLKGLTRHSVDLAQGSNFVPANQNFLRNGGFDRWRRSTNIAIGSNGIAPHALAWQARIGSGDSAVVTRESAIVASRSQYSCKLQYNHVGGAAYIEQVLPPDIAIQLRSTAICFMTQLRQGIANNCRAFIDDGAEVVGSLVTPVNSFATTSVTRTVSAGATSLKVGIKLTQTDVVYMDNSMLVLGLVVPTFTPRGAGLDTDQMTYDMADRMYTRQFILGAN